MPCAAGAPKLARLDGQCARGDPADSHTMSTATDHNPPDGDAEARFRDHLEAQQLLQMLADMMLIRRFEQRTAQSYQQVKIGGFCHLYTGQEAVAVGSIAALRDDDPIITAYRDHGHALARGMNPGVAMAEMFGRATGCSKGKGGSMHMFDRAHHMYGGHAIVAGQIPIGVGLAFAIRYNCQDKVCVCYFGDGALNQGAFHEAMNLAAIWQLPIIFACENNLYSMGTHIGCGTSMADNLSAKAAAYGIRYAECDGMDILDVFECFAREVAQTRAGKGPAFINAKTYRYKGHSMSDPQKYRKKEEVGQYEQNDPIRRMSEYLTGKGLATRDQIDAMDRTARAAALEAIRFADESPSTPTKELYTDIYANPYGPYRVEQDPNPPSIAEDVWKKPEA